MPVSSPDSVNHDLKTSLLVPGKAQTKKNDKNMMGIDELEILWRIWIMAVTFHTMVMIFADREPDWKCTSNNFSSMAKSVCGFKSGSWEWIGLICGDKYKVGLVQSSFFAGCMVGAGVFGHLSDSFLGRKGSLIVVCVINSIFGCLTALSPNSIYTLLRFLTGFSTDGVGLCAFILSTEPISWRALYIASSIPSILCLLFVIPFVSESPRWYLVRGKIESAMKIMKDIAKGNGKQLPDDVSLQLDDDNSENSSSSEVESCNEESNAVSGSLVDVVKLPITRVRLILTVAINFMCSVVYYGLSLNVANLDTNLYVNVLLNAVAEMPAFTLTANLLDKYGRKPLAMGTMWFSGAFFVRMVYGILGIFGMAGAYNLLFIYTAELFPTVVRNAALGCATQASQMGAILAPLVVVMGGGLPFVVFGICGIFGGLLVFYLPETLNQPLYDTIGGMQDGEKARMVV
ncbi:hypothetical protein MKX01_030358 [Papaver californicum]|nr:hypothetical protein MKX01_030358 [Papaver californicum]